LNFRRIGNGKAAATNIGIKLQKITWNQGFEIRIELFKPACHGLYMSNEQNIKITVKTIHKTAFPNTLNEQKIFAAFSLS